MFTLDHVSSRTRSEFGTLGDRLAAMKQSTPQEPPLDPARHVWVTTASGRQAGLLVAWVSGDDGSWWGKVAVSDEPGEASLQLIAGTQFAPRVHSDSSRVNHRRSGCPWTGVPITSGG